MAIYPDVIQDIRRACQAYRDDRVLLTDLQTAISSGANAIVAVEENRLRQYLDDTEGRLELIRFTTNAADVRRAALIVIGELEVELSKW